MPETRLFALLPWPRQVCIIPAPTPPAGHTGSPQRGGKARARENRHWSVTA